MIPHARVGGIAGLLELLQDRGGKEYLHRLAEVLIMDAEDLLPIVEASVLLGFATLKEGDVQITPEGARFAEADILTRKILFRQAALEACCDSAADRQHSARQDRPLDFGRIFLRHSRRAFQRG